MAYTDRKFSMVKYVGNSAYAFGTQRSAESENDTPTTGTYNLLMSADYSNWSVLPELTKEYNETVYGSPVTDVKVVDSSDILLATSIDGFTYGSDIDGFVNNALFNFRNIALPNSYCRVYNETETSYTFLTTPNADTGTGSTFYRYPAFGSGSYSQISAQTFVATNVDNVTFLNVDKTTSAVSFPTGFLKKGKIEFYNSTEDYYISFVFTYGDQQMVTYDGTDYNRVIAINNTVPVNIYDSSVPVVEFGNYFLMITNQFDKFYTIIDKNLETIYSGAFDDYYLCVLLGMTYEAGAVKIFIEKYDDTLLDNVIKVFTTTDGETWTIEQFNSYASLHPNSLIKIGSHYYIGSDAGYIRTQDFVTSSVISEIVDDLTRTATTFAGTNGDEIFTSSDGISFVASDFVVDIDFTIENISATSTHFYILLRNLQHSKIYKSSDMVTFDLIYDNDDPNSDFEHFYTQNSNLIFNGIIYDGTQWLTGYKDEMFSTLSTITNVNGINISIPNILTNRDTFYVLGNENIVNDIVETDSPNFLLFDQINSYESFTAWSNENFVNVYMNSIIYDGQNYVWAILYTTSPTQNDFGVATLEIRKRAELVSAEPWTVVNVDQTMFTANSDFNSMMQQTLVYTHRSFHYNGFIYFIILNNIIIGSYDLEDWFRLELYSTDNFDTVTPIRADKIFVGETFFCDYDMSLTGTNLYYRDNSNVLRKISNFEVISENNQNLTTDVIHSFPDQNISPTFMNSAYNNDILLYSVEYGVDQNIATYKIDNDILITGETLTCSTGAAVYIRGQYIITVDEFDINILNVDTNTLVNASMPAIVDYQYIFNVTYNRIANTFSIFYVYIDTGNNVCKEIIYDPLTDTFTDGVTFNRDTPPAFYSYDVAYKLQAEGIVLYVDQNTSELRVRKTVDDISWSDDIITTGDIVDIIAEARGDFNVEAFYWDVALARYVMTMTTPSNYYILHSTNGTDWSILHTINPINVSEFPPTIVDSSVIYTIDGTPDVYIDNNIMYGFNGSYIINIIYHKDYFDVNSNGLTFTINKSYYSTDLQSFSDVSIPGTVPLNYDLFSNLVIEYGNGKNISETVIGAVTNGSNNSTIIGVSSVTSTDTTEYIPG